MLQEILSLVIVLAGCEAAVNESNGSSFSSWLNALVTKTLYTVIIITVMVSFLVSWKTPKNEFIEKRSKDVEVKKEDWRSNEETEKLLAEAQKRNEILKQDLEELNRLRLELEEKSGRLKEEKEDIEERVGEARVEEALKVEELKKEISACRFEVKRVEEENRWLLTEQEARERESRISQLAVKEERALGEALEKARVEQRELEEKLAALRQERDKVVAEAARLVSRAKAGCGDHISSKGKK